MAFTDNTAFEVVVSNATRNALQNITGKFGTGTGTSFVGVDCSAGTLCVTNGLLPLEGYEAAGLYNKNSYYMVVATAGTVAGMTGDRTGIYACNTYDVNKANANGVVFNFAGKTLGLGVPADERGDFTEIIVGEQYAWGAGNFSTLPDLTTNKYATIATNGSLAGASSAPSTAGTVYFELVAVERFTEGAFDAGAKYTLKALRA